MVSSSLTTLLALSAVALAVPHNGRHHFHGTGMRGTGFPQPTGGFAQPTGGFPTNGTEGGPFGNGTEAGSSAPSGTIPVITATVVPVPEGSDVADATKGPEVFTSPADINQGQAASSPVADATAPAAGGDGVSSDMCTTITTTATSIQYVTVTAGADEVAGESQPSPTSVPTPAASDASAAASSVSTPAGLEAPESSVTIASAAPSVSAGAFYGGGHSFTYGGGGFGQSSAAAATTMMTSYGGGAPASSAAPVSSAAGSVPSSTPSTPPSSGGGGGKKGLSYNTASLLSAFDGTGMSWAYNWADSAGGSMPSGIEYVPMCWSGANGPEFASKAAGASHVLSFNEPDLGAQSNMDPATAAADHIKYLNPLSGQAQIGSPAITNGAGTSPLMGIDWLNAFFKACNGQCKIDFVAFHWYDASTNMAYFKSHVQDVINAAAANNVGKVWLTEFATTDGNHPDFISEATSFLDQTAAVERYAYFMVDNVLEQGGSLSALGQAYAA